MDAENKISIQTDLLETLPYPLAVIATALTLAIVCEKISRIRSHS